MIVVCDYVYHTGMYEMKKKIMMKIHNKGFTLLEPIIVMAILAILLSIAVPLYKAHIERANQVVCNANCVQLEKMYHTSLLMENKKHTTYVFDEFLQNYKKSICPANGDIKYENGKVRCVLHSEDEVDGNEGDEDDGSVPYL